MRNYYFNIPIDLLSMDEAVAQAELLLRDRGQHTIMTPNPEMLVLAEKDPTFASALRSADLSLLDGAGLALAVLVMDGIRAARVPGVDFLEHLLAKLGSEARVFLLGGEGTSHQAGETLRARFGTAFVGSYEPPRGTYDVRQAIVVTNQAAHQSAIAAINDAAPTILIVALGHNLQEKWLRAFLKDCPSVRVGMGAGGTIDYWAGKAKRAPQVLRSLGLEWLWRVVQEPQRLNRILVATIVFPFRVALWMVSRQFRYRPSAVGCILNEKNEVLLVTRIEAPDHWQMPQGGIEKNETPAEAATREMREELGTDKLKIIGQSRPNIYRYAWRDKAAGQRRYPYRGQAQTVFFFRFFGQNSDIHLEPDELATFRWVPVSQLVESLHPLRQKLGTLILPQLHELIAKN